MIGESVMNRLLAATGLVLAVAMPATAQDSPTAKAEFVNLAGRPTLIHGTTQLLFGGMGRLTENVLVNVKNKSHSVTAEVVVPKADANWPKVQAKLEVDQPNWKSINNP
jgi:hypothetical protein